ncbi:MAG: nitroreductase family protein [Dehalococcoidales bacterium]|nr:nitroreductase family protein [Dehalococcoidales bacterium]
MDYDTYLDFIRNRRTIRRFKPDPIPDEYIEKIIEAARWAPSGFNMQPWDYVVIKKQELREAILGFIREFHGLMNKTEYLREEWQRVPYSKSKDTDSDYKAAPVFILLLGDTRTLKGLPMSMRYDLERRQTIHTSSMASTYLYMSLAATTLGLANEWMSVTATAYPHTMIKDLIGIPPELDIYDMMVLGWPAYHLDSKKLMRDRDKMVHYDDCGPDDFRTDEEVNDFIKKARVWTTANHRRGVD